ncbi:hypothetical protein HXX76_013733 [Chlamydomonas incerta]|uniref:Uncharacterized protein n=1 Tax=Chlamydomonas incerta TaxID=51695 RepID=Q1WLT7_CHLIN|nr:chloroplast unknown lumenal polypeptide [Chlamydomonas incerta]KAG2425317.1 hypothetical protein HXX76_013733 [Chlamydomonas incerta]|eukprot:KAG2425317.1 hypothetical protein HXX76_013733 [Chlamydomonas incerta]
MASLRCSVATRAAVPARRSSVVVRASAEQTSKRAMLGLLAGAVAGALLVAPAEAIRIPSHDFTGGMVKGGGSSPKSPTAASMESYTLEGTKKQGVSLKAKKKLLAKVRENAQKSASS